MYIMKYIYMIHNLHVTSKRFQSPSTSKSSKWKAFWRENRKQMMQQATRKVKSKVTYLASNL